MKLLTYLLLFVSIAAFAEEASYTAARAAMVEELQLYAQFVGDTEQARISDAVMTSMNTVKRHQLVPQPERRFTVFIDVITASLILACSASPTNCA